MRRTLLIATAALALLGAAAVAGVGRPGAARGDVGTTPDTVTTTGHGVVTTVPDVATVTAGVHTQATTATDALARNSTLMNAVVAALEGAGGSDLQTQQVSLSPQTSPDGQVTGYAADDSVSAQAKIADAGALIDAAVGAGANTVDGPALDVSDTDTLYRQALQQAVADARAKASALAAAGGFGVGPVVSVVEQTAQPTPQPFVHAAAAPTSTPVEPGTQQVAADVTVTFRIL